MIKIFILKKTQRKWGGGWGQGQGRELERRKVKLKVYAKENHHYDKYWSAHCMMCFKTKYIACSCHNNVTNVLVTNVYANESEVYKLISWFFLPSNYVQLYFCLFATLIWRWKTFQIHFYTSLKGFHTK